MINYYLEQRNVKSPQQLCSVKGWIPLQETSVTGYTSFTHLGGSA